MKKFLVFIVFIAILSFSGYYYLKNYFFITVGGQGYIELYGYNVLDTVLKRKLDSIVFHDLDYDWINSDIYFDSILQKKGYINSDALFLDLLKRYKEDRYIKVILDRKSYLFRIGIIEANYGLNSSIILISACSFGEDPPSAADMGQKEKEKYRKLFDESIISKIIF